MICQLVNPDFKRIFSKFFRIFFKSSNLKISSVLIIFLYIIDRLFIKYNMMNLFSGNLSGFRIFLQIFRFQWYELKYLHKIDILLIKYDMMFFSGFFPVSGFSLQIFPVFRNFPEFFKISYFIDFDRNNIMILFLDFFGILPCFLSF